MTIWLCAPDNTRLTEISNFLRVRWLRVVNGVGWFELVVPGDFDESLLAVDDILQIWRNPTGSKNYLEFTGFLRVIKYTTDSNGLSLITLSGPCIHEIVRRRIVAYAAGSAYAEKTDYSDDLLKALLAENLGSSAVVAARSMAGNGVTIAGDESDGASITYACAWDELEGAIADLVKSTKTGTDIYWEVKPDGFGAYKIYTYTGQPGLDRTQSSNNPVVFGLEFGNLDKPSLTYDYSDEITYVYAGGQGEGTLRTIVEVQDAVRSGRSIWGRREAFIDCRNETSTAAITSKANAALVKGEPKVTFTGTLLSTPQSIYGADWGLGDKVIVTYHRKKLDVMVMAVRGDIDANGVETIEGVCEVL